MSNGMGIWPVNPGPVGINWPAFAKERKPMFKAARDNSRGFTLIEVLMVIVILGLLATLAIVELWPTGEAKKVEATSLLIGEVGTALDMYKMDIGHYPNENEGGLKALREKPTFDNEKLAEKWHGPYLKKEPMDAWSNPLKYELLEGTGGTEKPVTAYKLSSNGPNGNEGDDDDISNQPKESEQTR